MTDSNREIAEVDLGISGLESPLTIERDDIIADGTIKGFHIVNLLVESIINDREHPEDKKFDWKISPEVMKNDKHCMNFKYDETKYRLLILPEKEIEDHYPAQDDEDSEAG